MECHEKMDIARRPSVGHSLIRRLVAVALFLFPLSFASGQTPPTPTDRVTQARQLCANEDWDHALEILQSVPEHAADLQLCYGTGLAHLGHLADAADALLAGQRSHPRDKRFPQELAGVAFKQKHYSETTRQLQHALKLDPSDAYTSDFLGTIYFLQGNLPAALKYWNRLKKPMVAEVRAAPVPKLKPAILDRAFAFSPESVLYLEDLETTEVRVQALEVFPTHQFVLQARPDSRFDLTFRNWEKNGWGSNWWVSLLLLLRGLPAQSVYPEVFNLGHQALNFTSFYRWDKEKRRMEAELSGPLFQDPKQHFRLRTDLRNENWSIRPSFTGPAPSLGTFNLRREALEGSISFVPNGRWQWSTGAEFSHRDFRSIVAGPALAPALLSEGNQLKLPIGMHARLWNVPERHLALTGDVSSQTGHIWSQQQSTFEKVQTTALLRWLPLPESDDYEVQERASAGKIFGNVPFDELSMLGIGGDNDLWMRGHIATRDGRKGSAPLGKDFFLSNWELDKNVYRFAVMAIKAGPFVDTGEIIGPVGFGPRKWLCDVGAQAKVSALGFGVVLSYGKDIRSGTNAVYLSLLR